jgi:hypothetical protein
LLIDKLKGSDDLNLLSASTEATCVLAGSLCGMRTDAYQLITFSPIVLFYAAKVGKIFEIAK